ncbi:GDP-L-fucose synthase [Gammaproteobacteria bacterium]|nr:GDP-L-fucose synthase [Gammaproteobacteria bacterium]
MKKKNKVWITGFNGMVGQALNRNLMQNSNYKVLKTTRKILDQTNQNKTQKWISHNKPDVIIITSALVGGIQINSKIPADFLYENAIMGLNIIKAAHESNCRKIIFLGASCMYPKVAKQPFEENQILDGKVEETNEGYAISKILGIKYIQLLNKQHGCSHIGIIPTASYGPNDCYDENKNHVIPALIKKIHNAKMKKQKSITLWGTGKAKREFIHVDDMASGIIHILENYRENSPINLGTGEEVTIVKLSKTISKIIGYTGNINFDEKKPDGIKRKILSNKKLEKLKWKSRISLEKGLELAYLDYQNYLKKS